VKVVRRSPVEPPLLGSPSKPVFIAVTEATPRKIECLALRSQSNPTRRAARN
jgi:hypothetical protein